MRRLLRPIAPLRFGLRLLWEAGPRSVVVGFALQASQALVPLAALLLLRDLIDSLTVAIQSADPMGEIGGATGYAILIGVVGLVGTALQAVGTLVATRQGQRLNLHVQELIHTQSVRMDLGYFENPAFNDNLHRAQRQGASRPGQVAGRLTALLNGLLTAAGVVVLLASVDPVPLVVLVVAFLPSFAVGLRHADRSYAWHERRTAAERMAANLDRMLTALPYAKEVRSYRLGALLRQRFSALKRELVSEQLGVARARAIGDLVTQAPVVVALVGTLIWAMRQTALGAMSVGELVMYYGALQRLVVTGRQVRTGFVGLYEDGLFLANLRDFLRMRPDVADRPDAVPVPELDTRIELRGVSFTYPGTRARVLDDVSLSIERGEVVALVGVNGSGKSTLVKLLNRLYDPDAGRVEWNGRDIRDLRLDEYRSRFATVFQDHAMFPVSAAENIAFGDVDRLDRLDEVRAAARRAEILQALEALPEGVETPLNRWLLQGAELSVGQWQRVALARAFFSEAPVVILDEPTASLDPLAEASLFDRFRELMRGRTTVLISHRLASVRAANRIHVLDEGRLVESGTHEELMAGAGLYASMYRAQADRYGVPAAGE